MGGIDVRAMADPDPGADAGGGARRHAGPGEDPSAPLRARPVPGPRHPAHPFPVPGPVGRAVGRHPPPGPDAAGRPRHRGAVRWPALGAASQGAGEGRHRLGPAAGARRPAEAHVRERWPHALEARPLPRLRRGRGQPVRHGGRPPLRPPHELPRPVRARRRRRQGLRRPAGLRMGPQGRRRAARRRRRRIRPQGRAHARRPGEGGLDRRAAGRGRTPPHGDHRTLHGRWPQGLHPCGPLHPGRRQDRGRPARGGRHRRRRPDRTHPPRRREPRAGLRDGRAPPAHAPAHDRRPVQGRPPDRQGRPELRLHRGMRPARRKGMGAGTALLPALPLTGGMLVLPEPACRQGRPVRRDHMGAGAVRPGVRDVRGLPPPHPRRGPAARPDPGDPRRHGRPLHPARRLGRGRPR